MSKGEEREEEKTREKLEISKETQERIKSYKYADHWWGLSWLSSWVFDLLR